MEYQSTAKFIRNSPRKVRLVIDAVKSIPPLQAIEVLSFMPKAAAEPVKKLLVSAVTNAKNKKIDEKALRIKIFEVNVGPVMKRWRAVARGTGHGYKKRMSHIRLVLSDDTKEK